MPDGRFVNDQVLEVGSVAFHCEYPMPDGLPADRLPVFKMRPIVEAYLETWRTLRPRRIVELGVYRGGSTAMLHALADAEKIVAVELSPVPVPVLEQYIAERSLGDVVRPYYGIDQSDRPRLTEIVEHEFGGAPLDVVVDDASHLYVESRASFETLFPYLRTDGLYIIEDWCWEQLFRDMVGDVLEGKLVVDEKARADIENSLHDESFTAPKTTPMLQLGVELLLAAASSADVVADVRMDEHWITVRRGPRPIEPGTFRLDDIFRDHFGFLPPRAAEARPA
jgi:predicted O-methyltransferase YrrM